MIDEPIELLIDWLIDWLIRWLTDIVEKMVFLYPGVTRVNFPSVLPRREKRKILKTVTLQNPQHLETKFRR